MQANKKFNEKTFLTVSYLSLGIFLMTFFILTIFLTPKAYASADLLAANLSTPALEIFNLVNTDRTDAGLPVFLLNQKLIDSAQLKATDMLNNSYFAHNSPSQKTPWYWLNQTGYEFLMAGENLAVNFGSSVAVNYAWMNSANHRASILKTRFSETGIALATGYYEGRMTTFVVQNFGDPLKIQ